MKTGSHISSLVAILKKTLFIYLPFIGCILFLNYRLPDNLVPTGPSRTTPLNHEFHNSFLDDPDWRRLLNFDEFHGENPWITPLVPKPPVPEKAKVAIIIDDVGYDRSLIREIAKIPIPLTWAFLPYTPYIRECLREAAAHNCEIMLHLPLEPLDQTHNPGPGVIRHNWSDAEIEQQFNRDLDEVPGAIGLNNHMGSLGTQDPRLMGYLMKIIQQKGLFFIDSMTSPKSVAEKYAREYQVPFAKRRVFIDNDADPNLKKAALRQLIEIALKDGSAIGIAHVKDGNAAIITEMLPEFLKAGIEFVPVSQLVK
jgi:polysaccharide deacetylase 2 family uncharacterized protein YibQ